MKERQLVIFLFCLAAIVYFAGLIFIDILDIDASLYAEMSRELLESGDFFTFRNRIIDLYLDKPPLIFWLSAISFKLFGISAFSYKLPSFLVTILGLYSTYRFARLYYGNQTGILAALILFSCQAWFLINHDVRTDTMLSGFVIFGSWQLAEYFQKYNYRNLIIAFAGFGFGMLSKGPISLVVPVLAFGSHILYKRNFPKLVMWEWAAGLLIFILIISPAMISLYRQYGPFGIEFYLWTQSFGRITGESHWKDNTGSFFFVHTFLWSFLPWSILAIYATIERSARLIRKRFEKDQFPEMITLGGFLLTFIILSGSSYKLPHYIYVVFPFAAIFTAEASVRLFSGESVKRLRNVIGTTTYLLSAVIWLAVIFIAIWSFHQINVLFWLISLSGTAIMIFIFLHPGNRTSRWYLFPAAAIIMVNMILNIFIYPSLQKYHAGKSMAQLVSELEIPTESLFTINMHSSVMDFHMGKVPPEANFRKIIRLSQNRGPLWIITMQEDYKKCVEAGIDCEVVGTFDHYPIQIITLKFLNPDTRPGVLKRCCLVRIPKQPSGQKH